MWGKLTNTINNVATNMTTVAGGTQPTSTNPAQQSSTIDTQELLT